MRINFEEGTVRWSCGCHKKAAGRELCARVHLLQLFPENKNFGISKMEIFTHKMKFKSFVINETIISNLGVGAVNGPTRSRTDVRHRTAMHWSYMSFQTHSGF